jgi:hypothetical protein
VPTDAHPLQWAFLVYSALKRAVLLAPRSKAAAALHPVLPATDLVKKILGIKNKDTVSMQSSNL